jgi:receptor protein-tyrosine kinase
MEFRTYARMLLKRWPIVVAFAALAAGAAYASAVRAPRVYRATAQLSVTPSVVDFYTGEAVGRLLTNFALQLKSREFAPQIGARMQPAEPADRVAGKVRAVAAPPEFRIALEVDDPDPERAQQLANAAATAFVDKIRAEVVGKERRDIQIEMLERADLPGAPVSPRPKRAALGAAILGGVLGAAIALLLEFWDDTVKSADEAAALLALPVLGAIPAAAKTGVIHGLRARRPARRGRLHQAALAGRGGVPNAPH